MVFFERRILRRGILNQNCTVQREGRNERKEPAFNVFYFVRDAPLGVVSVVESASVSSLGGHQGSWVNDPTSTSLCSIHQADASPLLDGAMTTYRRAIWLSLK